MERKEQKILGRMDSPPKNELDPTFRERMCRTAQQKEYFCSSVICFLLSFAVYLSTIITFIYVYCTCFIRQIQWARDYSVLCKDKP